MAVGRLRTGDLLVQSSLITEQQLESALQVQKSSNGKKLGEILVDLGVITEDQLLGVLQKHLNIPQVGLDKLQASEAIIGFFPEELAREKNVFPYRIQGRTLYVATSDPLDYEALNAIGVATGRNIEPVIATKADINAAINRTYRKHNVDQTAEVLNSINVSLAAEQLNAINFDEVETRVESAPVVRFVNDLITQAHNRRASDVHIEAMEDGVRVRFRIDGELVEVVKMNMRTHTSIVTRIKIMAGMDIAEKRIPLDGRFNFGLDNSEISVRAASMPTVYGEKIVLRLMPDNKTSGILPLEALGFDDTNSQLVRSAISNQIGLILVTGPTGSGKSTTLYSLLNELSVSTANILTVEDPVEKIVPGVNQTQVNVKAGLTFATGLRAILRQDPDKIMIGEIRDTETADIAARAAITGHLVLASVHTNSAAAAFMRLVDMGVEPYVIASSIIAVIGQRLVRLICTGCKAEYTPTEADKNFYKNMNVDMPDKLYHGKGCEKCDYTGFFGRTGVFEVIITDANVRNMIMAKAKSTDIEDYLIEHKHQRFMLDNALDLVNEGKIFIRELLTLTQTFE